MKIKTITCHDVYNVGASLQAYALALYLHKQGHEIEIINYKPDYLKHYELFGVRNPRYDKPVLREVYQILKFPGRLASQFDARKKAFDDFTRRYLPVGSITYRSNDELKKNPPEADLYIAGSDQIWNPVFQNGKDPAFFLDFVPGDKIRASYAASFATTVIPQECEQMISAMVRRLDYVSVRENSAVSIVEKYGVKNAVHVLDPVFLLSTEEWCEIELPVDVGAPYLFVYDFENDESIRTFAIKKAEEKGLKIVSMFRADYSDMVISGAGPREFISLIRNAEYVVSNSFHATAFSILFHVPFAVFDRNEQINERMKDILSITGLYAQNDNPDYKAVEKRIEARRTISVDYLEKITCTVKE